VRSERVTDDPDGIQRRWALDADLTCMLIALERRASETYSRAFRGSGLPASWARFPGLFIISGYRSPSLQDQINPAVTSSLHTRSDRCNNPSSLAVDLRLGDVPASVTSPEIWGWLGGIWKTLGGRWGGDFSTPDLNHFDTGGDPLALSPASTSTVRR